MIKQVGIAIFAMLIIVLVGNPVMAQQVQVYSDPVRFDILAKAPAIPIPTLSGLSLAHHAEVGIEDLRAVGLACKSLLV